MTLAELLAAGTPVALLVGLIVVFGKMHLLGQQGQEAVKELRSEQRCLLTRVTDLMVRVSVIEDRCNREIGSRYGKGPK